MGDRKAPRVRPAGQVKPAPSPAPPAPRSISLIVHGTPKPKGSSRAFIAMKAGKARAIVTSDNQSLRGWESAIRFAAQSRAGEVFFDGPVALHVQFFLQRPKSVSFIRRPFHTTKPDLSKLVRGLEDALTTILWRDDAQIMVITAAKLYAAAGETSRAEITVCDVVVAPKLEPRVVLQ